MVWAINKIHSYTANRFSPLHSIPSSYTGKQSNFSLPCSLEQTIEGDVMKLELGFLKTIFYHLSNPWSSVLALGLFCRDCHNQGLVITITDLLYLCLDFKWVLSVLTFSSLCSFEKSRIPRSIGELERRIFWIFEKFSFKMTLLSVIRREEEDRFKHRCVSAVAVLSVHSAGRCQLLKVLLVAGNWQKGYIQEEKWIYNW